MKGASERANMLHSANAIEAAMAKNRGNRRTGAAARTARPDLWKRTADDECHGGPQAHRDETRTDRIGR